MDKERPKTKILKINAIILDGVVFELVKPKIESCNKCDLDEFCNKFKEPLCDMLAGGDKGLIFKRTYTIEKEQDDTDS